MSTAAIVTGTDGSPSAAEAVRQAAVLSGASRLALHIVSARRPGPDPAAAARAILDAGRDAIAAPDLEIHLHAEPGSPADVLCAVATRVGADLIVVGNKGVDASFGRRFSISEQVERKAPCPVLVIDTRARWGRRPGTDAPVG